MKITKKVLKQIIQEEMQDVMEADEKPYTGGHTYRSPQGEVTYYEPGKTLPVHLQSPEAQAKLEKDTPAATDEEHKTRMEAYQKQIIELLKTIAMRLKR